MIDQLYRKAILTVAERPQVEKLARDKMWPLAQRFVAGENIDSAIKAVQDLQRDGIQGNLDLLGEFIDSPAKCTEFAEQVLKLIDAAHAAGITPYVSIKLSSGQDEGWTKACKLTLTCCKFLLAHASNVNSESSREASSS